MRTLVTGGAGFIGSNLVDRLLAEGHSVDVIDDLSTGNLANLAEARAQRDKVTFHHLDIRSEDVVDVIARRKPEVVFHLAAQADVRVSVARPAFDAEVNILGSLHVIEGARQAGAQKVVFAASGGTLYGDPDPSALPIKESHPQQPLSPYGVAKKAVGDYLVAYRELHGLEFTALALANVYGPRQDPHGEAGVVAIFAGNLLAGEPCTVYGDGQQTRDFVYVDDVVDAFARAATKGGGLVLNIGTGVETSVNDLYLTMAAAAGVAEPALSAPARPGELLRSALDPGRAAIHLGWKPWTTLAEGSAPSSTGSAPAKTATASGRGLRPGADELVADRAVAEPCGIDAADDGDRDAAGLAHDQLGGRRQLVGHGHLGDLQDAAERVGGAAQVDDGGDAGAADGDVGEPLRQARPNVSETITPTSTPARARRPSRMRRAERSESMGRRAAKPCSTFERSTPVLAHTKPWLVSVMMRSPRRRSTRTASCSTRALWLSGSSGSTGTSRPSAFDTIFWVTTTTSPSTSSACSAIDGRPGCRRARISPMPSTGVMASELTRTAPPWPAQLLRVGRA